MRLGVGPVAGVVVWLLKAGDSFAEAAVVPEIYLLTAMGPHYCRCRICSQRGLHSSRSQHRLTSSVRSLQ